MKQEELNLEEVELAVGVAKLQQLAKERNTTITDVCQQIISQKILPAKAKPYSPEELAILLGVTRRTIYNYIYTKKVEAYKVNRSWRVKYSEVAKLAGWC